MSSSYSFDIADISPLYLLRIHLIWDKISNEWRCENEETTQATDKVLLDSCMGHYNQLPRKVDQGSIHLEKSQSHFFLIPCSFEYNQMELISLGIITGLDAGKRASSMDCFLFNKEDLLSFQNCVGQVLKMHKSNDSYDVDLTRRETDVLKLIRKGHTQKKIASILGISTSTVETYKSKLFKKFNVRSSVELVTKSYGN